MRIMYENEILKPPKAVFPWIAEPEKAIQWQKNVKGFIKQLELEVLELKRICE
jgi:hypothetical protein